MIALPRGIEANAAVRRRLLRDGAKVPGAAREIRAACSEDILFWVNGFCWTYDPRRRQPLIPFVTYPYQDEALLKIRDAIWDGHDVGVEKSRDMGASWINLLVATWLWQFRPMQSGLLVSRNEDYVDAPGDSKSLFWKIDFLLEHQPRWLRPRTVRRTSLHIENVDNGSILDGESTTGDVARGDRRTFILLDEYAAFEVSAGYKANSSTMSATDCRIFNSTPRGSGNAFYDLMHNAGTEIVRMHWSQHPEKARGLYTSVRGAGGKWVLELRSEWRGEVEVREAGTGRRRKVRFPEEYPFVLDGRLRSPWYDVQCSRATNPQEIGQELDIDYLGSDYQFFDPRTVESYRREWCRDAEAVGDLDYGLADGMPRGFVEGRAGSLSLWELPGSDGAWGDGRRFVVGADVSAGTGASNSAAVVYDASSREKVAEWANPKVEPRDFAVFVLALARWFNGALVVVDRSGPTGEQFVKRFVSDGEHPPLYRRLKDRKISQERVDEYGVFLNPAAKSSLLIEYRAAIGEASVLNRSDRAMEECLQFIRSPRGDVEHSAALKSQDPSGARSAHGDIVIADALASLALGEADLSSSLSPPEPPVNSVAWRMAEKRRLEAGATTGELVGGGW